MDVIFSVVLIKKMFLFGDLIIINLTSFTLKFDF